MPNPEDISRRVEQRKELLKQGAGQFLRNCLEISKKLGRNLIETPFYVAAATMVVGEEALKLTREKVKETREKFKKAKDSLVKGVSGAVERAKGRVNEWREKRREERLRAEIERLEKNAAAIENYIEFLGEQLKMTREAIARLKGEEGQRDITLTAATT